MKVFTGEKGKKGYTMLEVILVVAILMIAMAITVPGVVKLSKNLEIAKLDSTAKEIYTAVQSRTISLSVDGQLSHVEGEKAESPRARARAVSTGTIQYVYKSGAGSASGTDMLLPLGSIEEAVRQNYYIIEYNPVTAMICGVYYWENKENDFLSRGYETVDPENRNERMTYSGGMVGYYGGEDVDRPSAEGTSPVQAELINSEELYLKIMQGRDGGAALKGTVTVTLTDLDKNVSREIVKFQNQSNQASGNNLTYDVGGCFYKLTLDSLNSGQRFSKLYPEGSDGSFHPGCNLKVTVAFQENGKQAQEESFLTNSLFESVQGSSGSKRTAYIACGRHLENLGLLWVYPDGPKDMSDNLNGVANAVQTENIDWHVSLEEVYSNPGDVSFKPIVNGNLEGFDGGGNTISHMDIFGRVQSELSGGIGLFSQFKGDSLKNVNLADCTVKDLDLTAISSPSPMYVGLLAGRIEPVGTKCSVSDCHAYATAGVDGSFNCSIEAPSGTDGVGGLFGFMKNTKMTKCFASLTQIAGSAQYAGGLAGCVQADGAVSLCYADTGVWSLAESKWQSGISGQNVGGLLGIAGGSFTLENSYAVGWVSAAASTAYGLAGTGSGTYTIQNCYAALMNESGIVKDMVPADRAAEAASCINYKGGYDDFDSLVTSGGLFVEKNEGATHAYGLSQTGGPEGGTVTSPVYPFPRLSNMPHYGDWPQGGIAEAAMAYFEVYEDNSIGFYNKDIFDTLKDSKIVMDGYALMLPVADASSPRTVVYNGNPVDVSTAPEMNLMTAEEKFGSTWAGQIGISSTGIGVQTHKNGMNSYYPLFLSSVMMTEKNGMDNPDAYYQKLEITVDGETGIKVYFNPYVAKSDFVPVTVAAPGTPSVSILRTSRQVTAYSYEAMQKTAAGAGDQAHTLRLERDISLTEAIKTDKTVAGIDRKDLSIPAKTSDPKPNVILELNGKTLTGTGQGSAVASGSGILEIYGYTAENPTAGGNKGTITAGNIKPDGFDMVYMSAGVKSKLTNVTINNTGNSGDSINMGPNVTLAGCTIIDG